MRSLDQDSFTATGPAGAGYVQVAPGPAASAPIGFWSNVNVEQPGQTVPNAAIANLGDDATIVIYTSTASHLLVDAAGYFIAYRYPVQHRLALVQPLRM